MANIFEGLEAPEGDPKAGKQRYYKDLTPAEREGFTRAMKAHLKDKYPEMSDADVGIVAQAAVDYSNHAFDKSLSREDWNAKADKIMNVISRVKFGRVGEKDPSNSYNEFFDDYLTGREKSIIGQYDKNGSWPMPMKAEAGAMGNAGNRDDLKVTGKGRGAANEERKSGGETSDESQSVGASIKSPQDEFDQAVISRIGNLGTVAGREAYKALRREYAGKQGVDFSKHDSFYEYRPPVETAGSRTTPMQRRVKKGGSKMGDSESFLAPAKPQTSPMDLNGSDSPLAAPEYMDLLKKKIGTA